MRMGNAPHDTGLSRKYLIAACEASLRRLRTDYLDLYICHQPDMFVPIEETLRAYEDLVTAGQGPLYRLLESFGVAGHEGAGGVGADRTRRATSASRSTTRWWRATSSTRSFRSRWIRGSG